MPSTILSSAVFISNWAEDMMMMPATDIRAIAWDIDGTLLDSEALHQETLREVCRDYGMDISDIPDERFHGVHHHDVWLMLASRIPAGLTEETWHTALIDLYIARSASLIALPGAVETVKALAARGFLQVCVSNSGRRVVDANLNALGIAPYLRFSISVDDVRHGKPNPEPYAIACQRLALAPPQVLGVEDSPTGFTSARAAGLLTAFYAPLGGGREGADFVVRDLREIANSVLGSITPDVSPAL